MKTDMPQPDAESAVTSKRLKRKGPGRPPGKGATRKQVDERIDRVATMLVRRVPKHRIKAMMRKQYDLGARSTENYIARARNVLIERSNRPKEDHLAEAMGVYEQVIRDPSSSKREIMQAQDALRAMFGLDQPIKIAPTTPDGEQPYEIVIKELSDQELAVLHRLQQKMSKIATGEASSN